MTTDPNREDRIRSRAYQIWERGGREEGNHEQHWHEASRYVDEDGDASEDAADSGHSGDADDAVATGPAADESPNDEGLSSGLQTGGSSGTGDTFGGIGGSAGDAAGTSDMPETGRNPSR